MKHIIVKLQDSNQKEKFWKLEKESLLFGAIWDYLFWQDLEQIEKEEQIQNKKDCLWITDDTKFSQKLLQYNQNVLVFLHEKNREVSFEGVRYVMENPQELDFLYLENVYRRLQKIPWDILETERCLLRETTVQDVEDFIKIYANPEITKYIEPLYEDRKQEEQYIRAYIENIYEFYGFGIWTILDKHTRKVIGRAGISYREGFDSPEIGFLIAAWQQRKGIAFEVCSAILKYAKEQFDFEKIYALVEVEHNISLNLCKKLGFFVKEEMVLEGKNYFLLQKLW